MLHATIPPLEDRELSPAERLAIVDRVDEILQLMHRSRPLGNLQDPLAEAIFIVLSRQTRESGYLKAYQALRGQWPTWEDVRDAPMADVARALTPAGFGPTRAQQVQDLLARVTDECDRRRLPSLSLAWLHDLPDADVERFLVGLPGMGVKSARCVMHYSLDRKVFAVDTHVRRILHRLAIVDDPKPERKVKAADYDRAVPPRIRQRLHVNLVHHGREYCRSKSPLCGKCPLISFCRTGQTVAAKPVSGGKHAAKSKPVAIELFAGGGGMGLGFANAGFDVAVAVELDRDAAQTYRIKHPGTVVLEADATTVKAAHLIRLAPRVADATVVVAGPPCQGYSAAGKRKADDGKNSLYQAVVDLAAEIKTPFVAIENVPGIRMVEGQSFAEAVNGALRDIGYNSEPHLLRACDYGVPQLRRRVLFLAQRADLGPAPDAPNPTFCPGKYCKHKCGDEPGRYCKLPATPTVLQCLKGLPIFSAGQEAEYWVEKGKPVVLNGSTMQHCKQVIDKITAITAGEGPISYRRLHEDLARTIVAGHRALPVHPYLHRTISVREAARIQGFGDTHVFCGSRSQQPLQVANAVPPLLAQAVAGALLAAAANRGATARSPGANMASQAPRPVGSRAAYRKRPKGHRR
jgi:DNA (cytosine-5)-methyltransferase 1